MLQVASATQSFLKMILQSSIHLFSLVDCAELPDPLKELSLTYYRSIYLFSPVRKVREVRGTQLKRME